MLTIEMSPQICSFICCITTLRTRKGLFTSVHHDVTCNMAFEFHDFVTQWTLGLPILKNDWLNNL